MHFKNVILAIFHFLAFYFPIPFRFFSRTDLPHQSAQISRTHPHDPYSVYRRVDSSISGHAAFQAATIPQLFSSAVNRLPPEKEALGVRTNEGGTATYTWMTLSQVEATVGKLSRAFLYHGVTNQQRILLYAQTRPEWFLCAQALFRIGATVATLSKTSGQEAIIGTIEEMEVEQIITAADLLRELVPFLGSLPKVKIIYVLEEKQTVVEIEHSSIKAKVIAHRVKLIDYVDLLEDGQYIEEKTVQKRLPKETDIAVVMYTSGSTGRPKGVIMTHGNILTACRGLYLTMEPSIMGNASAQTHYAYLPLAHIFELHCEVAFFGAGFRIGYGSITTMFTQPSGSVGRPTLTDLSILQPTVLIMVPIVLERMRLKLKQEMANSSWFRKQLFKGALRAKNICQNLGCKTSFVDGILCKMARETTGGQLGTLIVGGAHLNKETQSLFENLLNIRISLSYGLTEVSGGISYADLSDNSLSSTCIIPGAQFRLLDWSAGGYTVTDKPHPRGELLIGGPSVSPGYFKRPHATQESFFVDDNGVRWFRTGDIVELLPGNRIQIIDRKKDLVKLMNGTFVSLGKIETTLKACPLLEQIAVFSSLRHNYLVALLSVNEVAIRRATQNTEEPLESLLENESVRMGVYREFQSYAKKAGLLSREVPRRLHLCTEKWSPANGLLTALMKINRQKIRAVYQKEIQALFPEDTVGLL